MNPYIAGVGTLFLALAARLALEAPPPQVVARPATVAGLGAPLDLNRATAAELEALPGIGARLAARIVAARDRRGAFAKIDDLLDIPGIGSRILAGVAGQVTVGARPPPGSAPPRSPAETAPSPR
jgi:competence ComEA-like helix-hairpin-helix protein